MTLSNKTESSTVWTPWGAQPITPRESGLAHLQHAVRKFGENRGVAVQGDLR